ncbi:MAG TPA: regulatory iron-sulfur-containing complex subunit RicT [Abditibacterium sp.]|jgi:cell fate regulator YaaT (PSP1 superfamily)
MPWVATCTFREPVKSYYLEAGDHELLVGTPILAETARGLELGRVKFRPREVPEDKIVPPLRGVARLASPSDVAIDLKNREWEIEALAITRARIKEHGLEMKAVKCELMFDRSKLYIYYESEERVDFRELLRDLSSRLSVRLHLQHVGPREAAKVLGGCGPCGQTLCCSTWLKETPGVNLKLAKEQRLSLTPSKISGACGRLMCCLRYEIDFYRDANLRLPKNGSPVDTPEGPGMVIDVNVFTEKCQVRLGDGRHIEVEGETLRNLREERGVPKGCASSVTNGGSCNKGAAISKNLDKVMA